MYKKFDLLGKLSSSFFGLNVDNLDEFKINSEYTILPYLDNKFLNDDSEYPFSKYNFDSFTINVADASKYLSNLSPLPLINYDEKLHHEFLDRFVQNLQSKLNSIITSYQICNGFPKVDKILTEVLTTLVHKMKNHDFYDSHFNQFVCNSTYIINSNEHNLLYHLTCILRQFSQPLISGQTSGMHIVCKSKSLIFPLFILSSIIVKSKPVDSFYSFIPCLDYSTNLSLFECSSTIVFQNSDIEFASHYCVSAVEHHHLALILVEEGAHEHLVERVKSIVEKKFENNCLALTEDNQTKIDKLISHGANLVSGLSKGAYQIPIILSNLVPSLLESHMIDGPIGYIIPFRLPKEASAMISHFVAQIKQSNYLFLANRFSNFNCNLWIANANVALQMFGLLSNTGVDYIFLNTHFAQLVSSLYLDLFESYVYKHSCLKLELEKNGIDLSKDLVQTILDATKAESIWMAKGLKKIQSELFGLKTLFDNLSIVPNASNCFTKLAKEFLFDPNSMMTDINPSFRIYCRLRSVGPIIIWLDQIPSNSNEIANFLTWFLFILHAGNSVVLVTKKDYESLLNEDSVLFESINLIKTKLNVNDLINWHFMNDLKSNNCSEILLDGLPGCFFQSNWNDSNQIGPFVPNSTFELAKCVKFFCSIGSNLFC